MSKEPQDARAPAHTNPRYVCARIRTILRKQGWPMHTMTGRYVSFCNQQTGTEGFSVRKVGCSKSVAVSYNAAYRDGRSLDVPRETRIERKRAAIELLRSLGYRVDDRGWIECDHYDEGDR